MDQTNRNYLFDNAKCLLIFLVVFAHLLENYTGEFTEIKNLYLVIYMFHMPFFIFISGYFSKRDGAKKSKLLFYYFIPYVFFNSLYSSLSAEKLVIEIFEPNWAFWYLLSLCLWKLIMPHMKALRFPILTAIIIALLAGYCTDINRYLSLSRMIVFFPYFIAGNLVDESLIKRYREKIPLVVGILAFGVLTFISIQLASHDIFTSRILYAADAYENMSFLSLELQMRGLSYVIAMMWIFCLLRILPSKKNILSYIGKYTMPVFIAQTLLIRNYINPAYILTGDIWTILGTLLLWSFLMICIFGNIIFQKISFALSYLAEFLLGKPQHKLDEKNTLS